MNKAYLLIGGNEGDRQAYLQRARDLLGMLCGKILQFSGIYETAAWGKRDQPTFLNQALIMETALTAPDLMHCILGIEHKMGRTRSDKYGQRVIDIDILFFNDQVINEESLIIPHPQLEFRRFALEPLHEIAPDFDHPVLHRTVNDLLMACSDILDVKKL